jgi:hypothetical protein
MPVVTNPDPPTLRPNTTPNPRPLPKALDRAIVNIPKHKSPVQCTSFPRHEDLTRNLLRVRTVTTGLHAPEPILQTARIEPSRR